MSLDLCFLYLKTVSILDATDCIGFLVCFISLLKSTNIYGWLTVQVSQLRLGLLRRLCDLEDESEVVSGLASTIWLA